MYRVLKPLVLATFIGFALAGTARADTTAQLQAEVTADQPAANAQVAAAVAQGQSAVDALISQVEAEGLTSSGGTTPMQYALTMALSQQVTPTSADGGPSTVLPPLSTDLAASNRCWSSFNYGRTNHIWSSISIVDWGVTIAHWEKDHGWWCGNGYSITSNGLPGYYTSHTWAQAPWCLDTSDNDQGWDAPHNQWAHGRLHGDLGVWTPWITCATGIASHTDVLRIAANGYYDTHNDY